MIVIYIKSEGRFVFNPKMSRLPRYIVIFPIGKLKCFRFSACLLIPASDRVVFNCLTGEMHPLSKWDLIYVRQFNIYIVFQKQRFLMRQTADLEYVAGRKWCGQKYRREGLGPSLPSPSHTHLSLPCATTFGICISHIPCQKQFKWF